MIQSHGSTSNAGNCIFCNKRTGTYVSFSEGSIDVNIYVCNGEEYDRMVKLKSVMQNNIRLIKSQIMLLEEING